MSLENMGKRAKAAARILSFAGTQNKNHALLLMADALIQNTDKILAENLKDLEQGKASGLTDSLLDRLALNDTRIKEMADGIRSVAALEDPVGHIDEGIVRPNGLRINKTRTPLGVVGIIFEARPNVTSDAAALCLKSGNAVILRGGKEAFNSNLAIVHAMRTALAESAVPADSIQLVEDTSRESAAQLMQLKYLDVLIPRGGKGLIKAVVENAKVPVIETGSGNCHLFIDESADLDMAVNIAYNAKTSRPSVCNAVETLLVHENIAEKFLPLVYKKLSEKNVALRGCAETRKILPDISSADEEDFYTEYNDYILAVKVVSSLDEAIDHIALYSSGHSECIVTESLANSQRFTNEVDSAAVYVNASTRFTDGGEFGLGAEIGISTQKLHARGPMGLKALTTTKFVVTGQGQIR